MSQIAEVNQQILQAISKTDPFYEALWGKVDFTPKLTITEPNDYKCGAICNQLEYLYAWIEEVTGQSFEDLPEPYLDIVVYFFTGLRRYPSEPDSKLLLRMNSLLIREGQQTGGWRSNRMGTPWDILNVISYYVPRGMLYYVPNAVITNLIVNGGFEDAISTEWTISPSGSQHSGDQFVGSYCLDFNGITSAAQTVSVDSGTYILHAFIDPASAPTGDTDICYVTIQRDSDSYYFDTTNLIWQAADPLNVYSTDSDGYALYEAFVVADDTYDVTITFTNIVDFFIDNIEFGLKLYPCFEIFYAENSIANAGFASLWVSGVTSNDYTAFIDQDYLYESGRNIYSDTYYQNILDMVKASGVKAIWTREAVV